MSRTSGGRSPRRALPGFSSQPVLVVQAATEEEAWRFPEKEVRSTDVGSGSTGSIVHGVLLVGLVLALRSPWHVLVDGSVSFLVVPCVVAMIVVVTVDLVTRATWQVHALAAVVGTGVGLGHGDVVGAVVLGVILGGAAWGAWVARRVRVRRWDALRPILEDGVPVHGRVISTQWSTTRGTGPVSTLRLMVTSTQVPGQTWTVEFQPRNTTGEDVEPEVGDRVPMFVSRSNPGAAVLRPVIPDQVAGEGPEGGPGVDRIHPVRALVVPARNAADARTFPRAEVLAMDVHAGRPTARRILHTVLFLALTLLALPPDVMAGLGLESARMVGVPRGLAVLLAIVLTVVDIRSVATWEMLVLGAVGSLALGVTGRASLDATVWTVILFAVAACISANARISRQHRWVGLRSLLTDHRLTDAVVVRASYDRTEKKQIAFVLLATEEVPGQQWRAVVDVPLAHAGPALRTGSRVALFVSATDPSVALLRPVTSSGAWRLG